MTEEGTDTLVKIEIDAHSIVFGGIAARSVGNPTALLLPRRRRWDHTSFHCLGVTSEDTLVTEKVNSKQFRRTINEEHFSILQEPGSVFVGHVAPSSGSAHNIANSILSYLTETVFLLHELDVIGFDGNVNNTGWKTGVICQIEKKLKDQLQWDVCFLHSNELPFLHLFINFDGGMTGPKSFSGPIGTQLSKCEKLPVVNFESNECEIPEIDLKSLSKDQ
ncbi:hypothetical protein AVEN_114829-1 [Araneus ventricosus]|uniref:Uncharacterized protein n=1 Tax=Araneus ventricosus TaxID=182803 RepID=A0A4Y2RGC3_ARAVE|nr:hypothetical protein AVEN_214505-1 [Araneus ventricosus]GBN74165.1 hypothetical protein AVEN_114829-1 [Araneus ventricosus]